ncbi:MAG: TraB/GumN family protein, partial [bacterium]|nr:TraB/GumN family protein [bacterium]
ARSSADAFARVWIEPVPLGWGASDYLAFLNRTVGPQLEIFEARHSEAHDVIRWSYRAKSLDVDLTFVETIVVREGYGVRIGYSTFSTLMSTYREEFDRLADAWLFENATQERWVADWAGLSGSLSSEDLDFIKIARRDGAAGCGPGERQLLWEVTGPKGSLFLFGSVHLGEPSNYPLPAPIESAFARSESLIVEFDITTPAAQREVSALMEQLGTLPPGEHIADHISPAAYRRLEAAFEDLGVPIRNFTGLKPWSLAMIVSMLKIQTLGYMDRYGVDRYFLQRAGAREIVSIETPDEQLRMLDSFDGELYLAFTLLGLETAAQLTKDMMRAWRCGDEEQLEYLFVESGGISLPGLEEVVEKMYYERNERMADFAAKQLGKPGNHFLVVGTAHMIGERGIPSLLRRKGYTVERR